MRYVQSVSSKLVVKYLYVRVHGRINNFLSTRNLTLVAYI